MTDKQANRSLNILRSNNAQRKPGQLRAKVAICVMGTLEELFLTWPKISGQTLQKKRGKIKRIGLG